MGVRGHLIKEYAGETFNLGEERVMQIVEENASELGMASIQLDLSGCGIIGIDLEVASLIIEDPDVEESTKEIFKKDIEWAKKNNDSWLKYYCF